MGIEQLKVHELVIHAVEKKIDIPEFQREFVWSPEQVKLLAESLHRGYPIGSLLLWDSSEYQEAKVSKGTQIFALDLILNVSFHFTASDAISSVSPVHLNHKTHSHQHNL